MRAVTAPSKNSSPQFFRISGQGDVLYDDVAFRQLDEIRRGCFYKVRCIARGAVHECRPFIYREKKQLSQAFGKAAFLLV